MAGFFDSVLRSTDELDFKRILGVAGLEIAKLDRDAAPGELIPSTSTEPLSFLGIGLQLGKSLTIDTVLEGGPGAEAGLAPGDEILAVDRLRLDPGRLASLLAENAPGTRLRFLFDRAGEIREQDVVLGI